MNVKTEICNLAQSTLGNLASVSDIDNPTTPAEKAYAKWFDTDRQLVLKLVMPNFALGRKIIAKGAVAPDFGYAYSYPKPTDCLKVLGIGEAQEKSNDYSVEGNSIITDNDYPDGMKLRYIKDVTDISQFTVEVRRLLAFQLAFDACIEITRDAEKRKQLEADMPKELSTSSSLNAQENLPVRINNSKLKASRMQIRPVNYNKK